jgi:iron(III) transport system substrate-binding protein
MRRLARLALAWPLLLVLLAAAPVLAQPAGKLVLYTSQPEEDARGTVAAFTAAHPAVEVEWTRNGTSQLMNVLRAEIAAGAPRPDVLLVADTINLGQLEREGLLLAYAEAPIAAYDAKFMDPDRTWFGTKLLSTGIVHHAKAPLAPTSWQDLVRPETKGMTAMPSPLYSGAALVHLHSLIQAPGFGWAYLEALKANGVVPQGGNGPVLKAVAGGQSAYGVLVDFLALRAKRDGSPIEFVFPPDGVSMVTEPVAILKSARNPAAARAFVDFVLSKAGQELVARQGYIPLHPEVAPPAGFPPVTALNVLPLDVDRAIAEDEAARRRFTALFGG